MISQCIYIYIQYIYIIYKYCQISQRQRYTSERLRVTWKLNFRSSKVMSRWNEVKASVSSDGQGFKGASQQPGRFPKMPEAPSRNVLFLIFQFYVYIYIVYIYMICVPWTCFDDFFIGSKTQKKNRSTWLMSNHVDKVLWCQGLMNAFVVQLMWTWQSECFPLSRSI